MACDENKFILEVAREQQISSVHLEILCWHKSNAVLANKLPCFLQQLTSFGAIYVSRLEEYCGNFNLILSYSTIDVSDLSMK